MYVCTCTVTCIYKSGTYMYIHVYTCTCTVRYICIIHVHVQSGTYVYTYTCTYETCAVLRWRHTFPFPTVANMFELSIPPTNCRISPLYEVLSLLHTPTCTHTSSPYCLSSRQHIYTQIQNNKNLQSSRHWLQSEQLILPGL